MKNKHRFAVVCGQAWNEKGEEVWMDELSIFGNNIMYTYGVPKISQEDIECIRRRLGNPKFNITQFRLEDEDENSRNKNREISGGNN